MSVGYSYSGIYGPAGRGLADFPTPSDAADWLASKANEFFALGPAILDAQHRAATLAYQANASGDTTTAGQLKTITAALGDLGNEWQTTINRWDELKAAVPGLGVWIIPVAWAAAVIAIAVAATLIFTKKNTLDSMLDAITTGHLTPAQYQQGLDVLKQQANPGGGSAWSNLSTATKWAVGGVSLVVGYKLLAPLLGGRGARA